MKRLRFLKDQAWTIKGKIVSFKKNSELNAEDINDDKKVNDMIKFGYAIEVVDKIECPEVNDENAIEYPEVNNENINKFFDTENSLDDNVVKDLSSFRDEYHKIFNNKVPKRYWNDKEWILNKINEKINENDIKTDEAEKTD